MTSGLSPYSALSLVRHRIHVLHLSTELRFQRFAWFNSGYKFMRHMEAGLFTAVSAAAMVSQRPWTTSNSGDGDLASSSFFVSCVLGSVAQGFEP